MFILALLFGVCQVFLTEQLIKAVNKKCGRKVLIFFLAKFSLYGIGIGLLILKHVWQLGLAFFGFVAGVPLAVIGLFVYKTFFKK